MRGGLESPSKNNIENEIKKFIEGSGDNKATRSPDPVSPLKGTYKNFNIPKELQRTSRELQGLTESLKFYIVKVIHEDKGLQRIRREKKFSPSRLSNYCKDLIEEGLIYKPFYSCWDATQKGILFLQKKDPKISLGKKALLGSVSSPPEGSEPRTEILNIHVHALAIKFELINDGSDPVFWTRTSDLTHSKKYFHYDKNYTIERTSRSIIIHLDFHVNLNDPRFMDKGIENELVTRINSAVVLIESNNVKINRKKPMDINVEYAIEDPLTRELRNFFKASSEIIDLGRLREKIFKDGKDQAAKLFWDQSHGRSIETKDRRAARNWAMIGENVASIKEGFTPLLNDFKEALQEETKARHEETQARYLEVHNKQLHQRVLEKMEDTLKSLDNKISSMSYSDEYLEILEKRKTPKSLTELVTCHKCGARFSKKFLYCPNPSCKTKVGIIGYFNKRKEDENYEN